MEELSKRDLVAVIDLTTSIVRLGLDLDGVMELVAGRACTLAGADGAAVKVVEGDELVVRAGVGTAASHRGRRIRLEGSVSGACLRKGAPARFADVRSDPTVDPDLAARLGAVSAVIVPLLHGDAPVGTLAVYGRHPGAFDARAEALLRVMSGVIASAMHHATDAQGDALFRRATRDDLTGLANRRLFRDRLAAWLHGGRDARPGHVLVADLDGMKRINDAFGHAVGDAVLIDVAARVATSVRAGDTVARLGGDEFGVLLPDADATDARRVMDRLRAEVAAYRSPLAPEACLSISVGAAAYPDDATDGEHLLIAADRAMYADKAARAEGRAIRATVGEVP